MLPVAYTVLFLDKVTYVEQNIWAFLKLSEITAGLVLWSLRCSSSYFKRSNSAIISAGDLVRVMICNQPITSWLLNQVHFKNYMYIVYVYNKVNIFTTYSIFIRNSLQLWGCFNDKNISPPPFLAVPQAPVHWVLPFHNDCKSLSC